MCVLQQITGIAEYGQCIHRQVSVTAAEALPTLSLINSDDLGAKQADEQVNFKREINDAKTSLSMQNRASDINRFQNVKGLKPKCKNMELLFVTVIEMSTNTPL